MRKLFTFVVIIVALIFMTTPTMAIDDVEVGHSDFLSINASTNNVPIAEGGEGGDGGDATAYGVGPVSGWGNDVLSPKVDVDVGNSLFGDTFSPEATIEEGAVDVDIENTNVQGQQQGQQQGQGQGQMNEWTQTFEDKRDHIRGPEILKSSPKFSRDKADRIKLFGVELLDRIKVFSAVQARKLASKASDIKIESAFLFENDFRSDKMRIGASGEFMGYLYVLPDGPDCNAAAMIGQAAHIGMEAGATHMELAKVGERSVADGSAWNIGIGGGGSIMSTSETTAIAPNGGLGYGKAKAYNEVRPSMVFAMYFDKALLSKYKVTTNVVGYAALPAVHH